MADPVNAMIDSTGIGPPLPRPAPVDPQKSYEEGVALLKEKKEARKPLEEKAAGNIEKIFENAKELKEMSAPASPKFQDMQPAPDSQYRDPTQALGSMASLLAIFGSFKTRAPFTAALNSAAAAMKGFHQGDKERVKLEREKWHDNMEAGLRQNQIEMQKYTAAFQAANFDIAKARPMFEALAASDRWDQMMIASSNGDYETMEALRTGRDKLGEKLMVDYQKDQEKRLQINMQREQHRLAADNTAALREQTASYRDLQRSDVQTRWFVANAQKQVKPYQETIRKANDIESNLIPGMDMPDTVKVQLKQLAGTRQVGRWTQGLDKNTGDIITRIFSKVQAETMGTLSEQDANAMKAFTANIKAMNAREIERIKGSMKPYADQYKIPESIFNLPFSASSPMGDTDLAYPGLDQSSADALGIVSDMVGK